MTPNTDQQTAIDGLFSFATKKGGPWCAFLLGYAGTGKTFTQARIIGQLKEAGLRVGLMAPTHKARKEALSALLKHGLKEEDLHWVGTVAKALGKRLDTSTGDEDGNGKWIMTGAVSEGMLQCDVVFCDEVSMVDQGDMVLFQRYFKDSERKLIFSGDFGQLRPVMGKSIEAVAGKAPVSFQLTEIMRTGEHSSIDILANQLRENVAFCAPQSSDIIVYNDPKMWQRAFLMTDDGVAIAYRNRKVDILAEEKRKRVYGEDSPELVVGGKYIVKERPVIHPGREPSEPFAYIADELEVLYARQGGFIAPIHWEGLPEFECWHLEVRNTSTDETLEIQAVSKAEWNAVGTPLREYVDRLKGVCLELQRWMDQGGWKQSVMYQRDLDRFRADTRQWLKSEVTVREGDYVVFDYPVKRAAKVAWAKLFYGTMNQLAVLAQPWAFTAHSAQGSTFDEVFIHWPDLERIKCPDDQRAAKYVAVSRAAKRVHIYR